MKKTWMPILIYIGAILVGCICAGIAALPFLKPGDFSVELQMAFVSVTTGFYILAFTPFVIIIEIVIRKKRMHCILPFTTIPLFGAVFPVIGFTLFSDGWWPRDSFCMIWSFLVLALVTIIIGTPFTLIISRNHMPCSGQCCCSNPTKEKENEYR